MTVKIGGHRRSKRKFKKAKVGVDGNASNSNNGNQAVSRRNLIGNNPARKAAASAKLRRDKIESTIQRRNAFLKGGSYQIILNTKSQSFGREHDNNSGVEVKSTFVKNSDEKVLKLRKIKIDKIEKLNMRIRKKSLFKMFMNI